MTKLLYGKPVAESIITKASARTALLRSDNIFPKLLLISVGAEKDNESYERGIYQKAKAVGVAVEKINLASDVSEEELIKTINMLNADRSVHGIMLFRPLPQRLKTSEYKLINMISPEKDVDGSTEYSMGGLMTGIHSGFCPCTPEACVAVLDHYGIEIDGKTAVIIGRSTVVGKPLAMLLLDRNATVTVCHSKTRDLSGICKQADILICAAGKAGLVTGAFTRPEQVVLDVSVNWNESAQKLCGDVDCIVNEKCAAITPVPGGIGTVTSAVLIDHVVTAAEKNHLLE